MKLLSFCKNNEHRYVMAKKMPTTELLWFGAKKQFSYKNQNAQNHEYDHFVVEKRLNFWVAVAAAFFMIRLNSFVQNALIWKWMQKLVWEMTKKNTEKKWEKSTLCERKRKKNSIMNMWNHHLYCVVLGCALAQNNFKIYAH